MLNPTASFFPDADASKPTQLRPSFRSCVEFVRKCGASLAGAFMDSQLRSTNRTGVRTERRGQPGAAPAFMSAAPAIVSSPLRSLGE